MQERSQKPVLQLDLNDKRHIKILNVVAKGIIKLAKPTFYKENTARDENSAKNALAEGLNQLAQMEQITTDSLERTVKGEVIIAVRAILENRAPGTFIFSKSDFNDVARASKLITQAMQCLKTNPNHSNLDWNYISHDIIPPKQAPQPRTTPPIIPSRKGFFDITPSTANRIGMFGISVFIFEIALALCSSALNTPTREQVAIFTSNPMFIVVNAIAFAATAFYEAIPETSSGTPNL
jgi:hypothetical protein